MKIDWNNSEERKKYMHLWLLKNNDKMLVYRKQYYQKNKEKLFEQNKQYVQSHKDELNKSRRLYYKTSPIGRATSLISAYNQTDRKYGLGKGNLTSKWIVDNIFTKSCVYCGETDWHKLGCNRKNNDLPHTIDNVETCCTSCNKKLPRNRLKQNGSTFA